MSEASSLHGAVAVVTGAAHGIGRATALRLAAVGARLVAIDRDEEQLADTAGAIVTGGGECHPWAVDCTDRAAVEAAFNGIEAALGPVDILVNNVGQSAREAASEFWCSTPETWDFVLDVSLKSAMLCARQVVPGMRRRRAGAIVNMSSDVALIGDTGIVDYVAAKAGVIGFTRGLARELAPFQVRVNAVAPGAIRTRAHDSLPGEVIDRVRDNVPMGWVAEPEEVAKAILFLASDQAAYITGHTLVIDGGRHML
ncbi:MAG: SDR family NAD(P)-dependent oxidoreductase [Alphaproteobacteria bacterium]|jgi:NAD(P)-dependent dehydrogenase (short-subunit alcohol dehydrogenase family)|nr:SDR family NAD(P)-dependent oxidoreductase [Alphaproteobacteria bacterium]MDP6563820.1 SDR family NAD(P)-dependent oxidoreductase [Alphaproteobacteria bacterium]MDP6811743.1 SDR family NAD(P)-dependent oxidoreductase [Alphaproteobacteria bacterium]